MPDLRLSAGAEHRAAVSARRAARPRRPQARQDVCHTTGRLQQECVSELLHIGAVQQRMESRNALITPAAFGISEEAQQIHADYLARAGIVVGLCTAHTRVSCIDAEEAAMCLHIPTYSRAIITSLVAMCCKLWQEMLACALCRQCIWSGNWQVKADCRRLRSQASHREWRNNEPWKMYLTVPDLSDIAPRLTSTMSPTATCSRRAFDLSRSTATVCKHHGATSHVRCQLQDRGTPQPPGYPLRHATGQRWCGPIAAPASDLERTGLRP
jgi:hypothetical protein